MLQQAENPQLSDLITEIESIEGVCFDPKDLSLHGLYEDELSAHRARKGWTEILETSFFLELREDFDLKVGGDLERGRFVLSCEFKSASARYAFWRLTHQQAPEAQYLIETAHLPSSDCGSNLSEASDMVSLIEDPFSLGDETFFTSTVRRQNLLARLITSMRDLLTTKK